MSALPAAASAYLDRLNEAQRAAVDALDGPVLVLAGAGTGKTRVLTTRIVHLIETRRAWPSQILAVTFTNKAAREMRDRVERQIGVAARDLWLGTFHAIAARMLRRHAELVGLTSTYTILDTDDQIRLLKQVLQAAGIDEKRFPARGLLGVIDRWKDRGLTPDRVPTDEGDELPDGKMRQIYADYQARLLTLNACDFGDLLLHGLTLLTRHPDVLATYHKRLRYLLVDEYQDTNVAQYLWLRLLAQDSRNICCVGDDDQSIYGWRGAEIENILRFERDFPGATVIRLEQNYRSTGHILAAAAGLIANNQGRLGKTLWTADRGGERVRVTGSWDGIEEARRIAEEIDRQSRAGVALGDMAILVRAGFQTREFEERLTQVGIPYRVIGGLRFYERAEVRDATAYLRVVWQPDDDLAFERIVNTPRRGLGDSALDTLRHEARVAGVSLTVAAHRLIDSNALKPAARKALAALLGDFARWRVGIAEAPPGPLLDRLLDESGYVRMLTLDRAPEAPGRLENLRELTRAIAEFETVGAFLEHVALVTDQSEESTRPQVTLMTLHAAKGLEFDVVFLPGWEEGLFPHQRALESDGGRGLEEERRLAYVGLTRARKRAFVSWATSRRVHNTWQSSIASRFIGELPADAIELSEPGRANGRRDLFERPAAWRETAFERHRGPTLDIAPDGVQVRPLRAVRFKLGERVFHQKFGMGTVDGIDGDRLTIAFDKAGEKTVLAGFVAPLSAS